MYLAETAISKYQKFVFYRAHFSRSKITSLVPSHLFFFKPSIDLTYANESFDFVFSGGLTLLCRNCLEEESNTSVSVHLQAFHQCTFWANLKYLNLYTEEKKLCSIGQTPYILSSQH